eukprot:TRINITY_DN66602_c0_g1_i1.p1 TRINITY_DN66602_c0_g1~~TRINITY_DN66602_c0_g1_i1.p1  ORF type:complete len:533 (+),score=160.18 TRINITY_DN66602_c0_g1_i1:81-1679(+)
MPSFSVHGMQPLVGSHGEAYIAADEAIAECSKKLRHHPEQQLLAARAEAYLAKGRLAAARQDRLTAVEALRFAVADLTTALSQGDRGQIAKADWYRLRGEAHKETAALFERGGSRRLELEAAERDFGDTLIVDHTQVGVLIMRAEVRLALAQYPQAADDFTAVLSRTAVASARVRAFVGRAEAGTGMGEHDQAVGDYSTALQLTMGQEHVDSKALADILYSRSQLHDTLGRTESCLSDLSKALELCPDHADALETRAALCYELGMYADAQQDLADALQLGRASSPQLAELFRKLQMVHTVTLHLRGARDLTAGRRQLQSFCLYEVRPCSGPSPYALVEGRTLTCSHASDPDWDEVIEFDLPDLNFKLDLSVRDDCPSADAPFLGCCEVRLPQQLSSGGTVHLALRPRTRRRADIQVFNSLTDGGKGTLSLAWHVAPKFDRYPPHTSTKSLVQGDASGVLCDGDSLRQLFKKFDVDGNGWLSRQEVRAIYSAFDNYGVPTEDVDKLIARYSMFSDDRITFDEFAILMLRISQR